ncbi:hypothetical protein LCGC14_2561250, partial [marine sediment metagenome]
MAFTPGVNYVSQRADGSFAVVVDGVAVDSGNLTQQQAEQLFNAETAPAQDIRQQPTGNLGNLPEGGTNRGTMVAQNPDGTWSAYFNGIRIANFSDQNTAQNALNTAIAVGSAGGPGTQAGAINLPTGSPTPTGGLTPSTV